MFQQIYLFVTNAELKYPIVRDRDSTTVEPDEHLTLQEITFTRSESSNVSNSDPKRTSSPLVATGDISELFRSSLANSRESSNFRVA